MIFVTDCPEKCEKSKCSILQLFFFQSFARQAVTHYLTMIYAQTSSLNISVDKAKYLFSRFFSSRKKQLHFKEDSTTSAIVHEIAVSRT